MTQPLGPDSSESYVAYVDSFIKELIPEFLEDRQQDIKDLARAREQGDYESIRVLGHNMKGAGGGYGFDFITELGRSLEASAKEQNSEEVGRLVEQLSTYLARVEVVYV